MSYPQTIMRLISLVLFTHLYILSLEAQSGYTTAGGANFLSFARAGVNIQDISAIYLNQAGLTGVKNFAVDVSVEKRFNLEELSLASFAVAKKAGNGCFGLMFSSFGFSEYSEQKAGLAYARKLFANLSAGGQLNVLRLNIAEYGSTNNFTFEAGVQYTINKEFSLGAHVFSPGNIIIADGTNLAIRFRLGLKYAPSAKVFLLLEADKQIDRTATEFKAGLSYQMSKEFELRMGANPTASLFTLGISARFLKNYKMIGAYGLQNILGNTPAISLQYHN